MKGNTKENILRAAIRIFAQKGYKAATVREIMAEAGAKNPSAVTYHFQGKENLYQRVLEFMFEDADKFVPQTDPAAPLPTPEEKLRGFILIYMKVLYVLDTELDADLAAIFAKELAHPSPFLPEMVKTYLAPGSRDLQAIIRELVGPGASDAEIRQWEDSIMGQIYYPLFAAPLVTALRPDEPPVHQTLEERAEQIFQFTRGGLNAMKN